MEFNKRVLGTSLVRGEFANINANFEGMPNQLADGTYYASSVSFKWTVRNYWKNLANKSRKVLVTKHADADGNPIKLDATYIKLFGPLPKKGSKAIVDFASELLANTFDVPNFGVTFAVKDNNFSLTGPVQVGYGLNLLPFDKTELVYDSILSPFASAEDKKMSTMGKIAVLSDSLFGFDFIVNPNTLANSFTDALTYRYSDEDFNNFKKGALKGATLTDSLVKKGMHNVGGIFITLKEGSLLSIGNVNNYIKVDKNEQGVLELDITDLESRLEGLDIHIESKEIYLDEFEVKLLGNKTFEVKNIDLV